MNETFKKAFQSTLPVLAGYLVLGAGFGIIMVSSGFEPVYAVLMSLFIYAGSMQYLAVTLMLSGASWLTLAAATLMVNARHLFYGISMIEPYKNTGVMKPYLIFGLTDETYSLVSDPCLSAYPDRKRFYFFVTLLDHCYWVGGTLLGSIFASVFVFNTKGIDFALTALFLTILTEQWLSQPKHFPAITGLGATALCLILFGPSRFLIPAMVLITAVLLMGKKFDDAGEDVTHE